MPIRFVTPASSPGALGRPSVLRLLVPVALLLAVAACRDRGVVPATPPAPSAPGAAGGGSGRPLGAPEPTPGVHLRLAGAAGADGASAPGPSPVEGIPLSPAEIEALVDRLPPLPEAGVNQTSFALPSGPQPPPRTGANLLAPFPPPAPEAPPAAPEAGALGVVRRQPEGDVDLASHLAVTFNQPMVAVAARSEVDAGASPVALEPMPPGRWRWVGTRTLLFEAEGRLPMATDFAAAIPAGTTSAVGGVLGEAVEWSFRTPPPRVVARGPEGGPTDIQPVIFAGFDQAIDAEAALARLRVEADGAAVAVRRATAAEVEEDESAAWQATAAKEGRWVALRPQAPLPAGAEVKVVVPAGFPSAEGPRVTAADQSWSFRVRDTLRVAGLSCMVKNDYKEVDGPKIKGCDPYEALGVRLSNPIGGVAFDPDAVELRPAPRSARVAPTYDGLRISGPFAGRTRYEVVLPAELTDGFGQRLGEAVTVTFETGDAAPALFVPSDALVVVDPAGAPALQVTTMNQDSLDVRLYRVSPSDWPAFQDFLRSRWPESAEVEPPGQLVSSQAVALAPAANAWLTTGIDLAPALDGDLGNVVVVVNPPDWSPDGDNWRIRPAARWVAVTRLGVDAFADGTRLLAWVTNLADGTPVDGAQVAVAGGPGATTDASGLAALPWTEVGGSRGALVVTSGDDATVVPTWALGLDRRSSPSIVLRFHTFDDRGLYRPGETVHVKGWVRKYDLRPRGDVAAVEEAVREIAYTLTDQGREVLTGTVPVGAAGGFAVSFTLPEDSSPGTLPLALQAVGSLSGSTSTAIRVSDFRRPDFEVSVAAEEPLYFIGDRVIARAEASYFAGGSLPGATVNWTVSGVASHYEPPGHGSYHFGRWTPPWLEGLYRGGAAFLEADIGLAESLMFDSFPEPSGPAGEPVTLQARTDEEGRHRLAINVDSVRPIGPASITAEAAVTDVNRQSLAARTTILVHPSRLYVGLRPVKAFVTAGSKLDVEAIVTDIDGGLQAGHQIRLSAARLETSFAAGSYGEQEIPAGECVVESKAEAVTCRFETEEAGNYRLTARVRDDAGRPNETVVSVWVAGPTRVPSMRLESERVLVVPDRESYAAGDTARILVQAPWSRAEGLATLQRSGVVDTLRFHMDGPTYELEVPIEEAFVPGLWVRVDLVGATARGPEAPADAPARPAFATGGALLPVPPTGRTLAVEVTPAESTVEPGATTDVSVLVLEPDGGALEGAELALIVVDEAILSLTDYAIADPLDTFYRDRAGGAATIRSRQWVALAELGPAPEDEGLPFHESVEEMAADGILIKRMGLSAPAMPTVVSGAARAGIAEASPFRERLNFDPVAAFEPSLVTDAAGRATATIRLPDNVTRYRITAVATDGGRLFGLGEATLTARLPLVVRGTPPRFLNYGDAFELPVVVQNLTADDLEADVVVRGANLDLEGPAGRRVTVPAGDRVEVRFPGAAILPGEAMVQIGAAAGELLDAQRLTWPVWTPATTEAFATYGSLTEGLAVQPVARPEDADTNFGGLEVTLSSTALSNLTDAFISLHRRRFDSAEARASRLLATTALQDVLAAFAAPGFPGSAEVEASVADDLEALAALQTYDGGFRWWRRGPEEGDPFLTVHVAHALVRAQLKGHDVPGPTVERAREYLTSLPAHLDRADIRGPARDAIGAYALYVRRLWGDDVVAEARDLFSKADDPGLSTLGWLLAVLAEDPAANPKGEILRTLNNRASEEAGTAQFTVRYVEEDAALILASNRRADAVVLDGLVAADPGNPLVEKVVRGLLAHRTRGQWGSTQENAWVLLALDAYFRAFESETPAFTASAWLGQGFLGRLRFEGRSPDRQEVDVPLAAMPAGASDLLLAKDGPGRLYYRLGLRYAPASLTLEPMSSGFDVNREYEAVDDPGDVTRSADGTWRIKAGARVRVRVGMVAPARRYHVALVDPLPAGLEALNPDLVVTETVPPDQPSAEMPLWYRWWHWYDSWGIRDEGVEAIARLLHPGVYELSYVARATTPGDFHVAPAKAEELYQPETFGRSASDLVVVR